MSDIVYEKYDKRSVAIRGNKNKYNKAMNEIGAKWNSNMKNGPGWILPKENEPELQRLIKSFQKLSKLDDIATHVKSRKDQNKYHREYSGSEKNSDEDSENDIPPIISQLLENEDKLEKKKQEENEVSNFSSNIKSKTRKPENKKKSKNEDPIDYYKSFNQKPSSFKQKQKIESDDDDDVYSSSRSASESESSDNFPSPSTPGKKNSKYSDREYNSLIQKMNEMQNRINVLEKHSRSYR
jgi:hypothetical protein